MPLLEASVSSRMGSSGSKCRNIGPAGFVMISFTFLSAASCTSSQTNLLHFFNSSCQDAMACFRSGFWSLNRLTSPIKLLRFVISFGAGNFEMAATKSGFIFEPSLLTMYPANLTTLPICFLSSDRVIPHSSQRLKTVRIRSSSCP